MADGMGAVRLGRHPRESNRPYGCEWRRSEGGLGRAQPGCRLP